MLSRIAILLLLLSVASCARSFRDQNWLNQELQERVGASVRGERRDELPSNVAFEDGLDEVEVAAIALWRSPALYAELTRMDAARATLDEASRPANPQLSLMGPIGPVSAVATLAIPLESLWQMPRRTEAAAQDADVAGETVLMRALDTVRDARLLHIELALATDQAEVRRELLQVALEVARVTAVRARVGDISPMEERVLSSDAQIAADASESALTGVAMARARLGAQLTLGEDATRGLRAIFLSELAEPPSVAQLIKVARRARPDVRAAVLSVSAAAARAGWERTRVVTLGALVEGHWGQPEGPALRLGGRAELPIFGANPGGIGRADAEVKRTSALHEGVARTTVLEVTLAHARFVQATSSRRRFESDILFPLDEALDIARRSFEAGDESYLIVLDVLKRAGEARLRRVELIAEQRRAGSELERAIGARLGNVATAAERAQAGRGGS